MSTLPRCVLNLTAIAVLIAFSLSIGCQTAPPATPAPPPPAPADDSVREEDKNDRIPDWVINPGLGGVIGALGVAPGKGMGTKEQLDEAKLNGRIELAGMLEGRVQRVSRTELEEDYQASESGRTEDSRKNILGVDRNILDMVLAGARQRALWFDPDNGEAYVWMVLDASLGQNAVIQAKQFNEVVPLTGIVVTKLDGSSKAGFLFSVKTELNVPILFAGLGEGEDDLVPFDPNAFVDALFDENGEESTDSTD